MWRRETGKQTRVNLYLVEKGLSFAPLKRYNFGSSSTLRRRTQVQSPTREDHAE
jgi:hypothetical protein